VRLTSATRTLTWTCAAPGRRVASTYASCSVSR
jgi:hypothetical protein